MTKDEIIEAIKQMNVVELADVVKALEDEFGISAAAPVAVAAAPADGGTPADGGAAASADQSEFEVSLKEIGPNKINVIKTVRQLTGMKLKKAYNFVESLPATVKTVGSENEAEKIVRELQAVGGKAACVSAGTAISVDPQVAKELKKKLASLVFLRNKHF